MKLCEFDKATESVSENSHYIKKTILVHKHKTAHHFGAANVHLGIDLYQMLEKYIKYGRPVSDSLHVFLTPDGNALSNQSCWRAFSSHINACQLGVSHISANMWRRAANSMVQYHGDPKMKEASSRQLTHSIKEGETNYHNAIKSSRSSRDLDSLTKVIYNTARQCQQEELESTKKLEKINKMKRKLESRMGPENSKKTKIVPQPKRKNKKKTPKKKSKKA